jgi:hypothetical protein
VIQLRYATTAEAMKILTALDLGAKVHACPTAKLLIVPQNDPNVEQIKTVVERLDAGKPEPKPDPKPQIDPKADPKTDPKPKTELKTEPKPKADPDPKPK